MPLIPYSIPLGVFDAIVLNPLGLKGGLKIMYVLQGGCIEI
jgi:hypothetical protein